MTTEDQDYHITAIRELLSAAFMDSRDLRRFCQSQADFRPVLQLVNEGAGLQDHVDVLIGYCETRLLFDELLAGIEHVNPKQYARFEPQLRRIPVVAAEPGVDPQGNEPAAGPDLSSGAWSPSGPLSGRHFDDADLNRVVAELNKEHEEQATFFLPVDKLLEHLATLLNRMTFRTPFEICPTRDWGERIRIGYQTLEVLSAYEKNVRERGTASQKSDYTRLVFEVRAYCYDMQQILQRNREFDDLVEDERKQLMGRREQAWEAITELWPDLEDEA